MKRRHVTTDDLSEEELRVMVSGIRQILWIDFADGKWDPDKEWSQDTIEYVAGVLEDAGLRPERKDTT
jgi:endo-1,4-beta-D-glucanase Y